MLYVAIINRHAISGCKEWSGIDSTVENLKSSDTARSARKREPVVAFGLLETSDAEVLATKLSESLQIHH
eukprot:CCRYP_007001-RA/>CCRYP_007001-RA protein AED:0.37 eAED:0.47 QI:0/0/0.5/1/0/0/2/82/69